MYGSHLYKSLRAHISYMGTRDIKDHTTIADGWLPSYTHG